MYQPITSVEFTPLIAVFGSIILLIGVIFVISGSHERSKRMMTFGTVASVLSITALLFIPTAMTHDAKNHTIMSENIKNKYNAKFQNPYYLRKVEFVGLAGKYEAGKYFNLTYNDLSVEKVLFKFDYDTGDPRCFCDLKEPFQ